LAVATAAGFMQGVAPASAHGLIVDDASRCLAALDLRKGAADAHAFDTMLGPASGLSLGMSYASPMMAQYLPMDAAQPAHSGIAGGGSWLQTHVPGGR
jgi:hypothetical protein